MQLRNFTMRKPKARSTEVNLLKLVAVIKDIAPVDKAKDVDRMWDGLRKLKAITNPIRMEALAMYLQEALEDGNWEG